jgi:hypothetical protein
VLLPILFSLLIAGEPNLLTLRSLKDVSSDTIDLSQPAVFMVFQKDCGSCHRQVKDLKCLGVPVYLIGAFSSESSLRDEYRRMSQSYPAYMGTAQVLKALGVSAQLTPQLGLFKNGKPEWIVGLTSCDRVRQAFTQGDNS